MSLCFDFPLLFKIENMHYQVNVVYMTESFKTTFKAYCHFYVKQKS